MSTEPTKVLTHIGWLGRLGKYRGLAFRVRAACLTAAVRAGDPAECPEVEEVASIPKKGGLRYAVGLGLGRSSPGHHTGVVNAITIAIAPAQSAKVCLLYTSPQSTKSCLPVIDPSLRPSFFRQRKTVNHRSWRAC